MKQFYSAVHTPICTKSQEAPTCQTGAFPLLSWKSLKALTISNYGYKNKQSINCLFASGDSCLMLLFTCQFLKHFFFPAWTIWCPVQSGFNDNLGLRFWHRRSQEATGAVIRKDACTCTTRKKNTVRGPMAFSFIWPFYSEVPQKTQKTRIGLRQLIFQHWLLKTNRFLFLLINSLNLGQVKIFSLPEACVTLFYSSASL